MTMNDEIEELKREIEETIVNNAGVNVDKLFDIISYYSQVFERKKESKNKNPEEKIVKAYLHSDKESMYDIGKENDLTELQMENFKYALYEVEFELKVDKEGNATIIKVDGKELK